MLDLNYKQMYLLFIKAHKVIPEFIKGIHIKGDFYFRTNHFSLYFYC